LANAGKYISSTRSFTALARRRTRCGEERSWPGFPPGTRRDRRARLNLGARDATVGGELFGWLLDGAEVVDPHGDLPHVGAADQAGASARRAITERDHRMLIATCALLGVAAKAIGQALAGGTRTEAEPFGEAIVEAD
jgi:hypothetical protein